MNGNKCCHGLNPVKNLGCYDICGRDAANWIKDNYPELSSDEITGILEAL